MMMISLFVMLLVFSIIINLGGGLALLLLAALDWKILSLRLFFFFLFS